MRIRALAGLGVLAGSLAVGCSGDDDAGAIVPRWECPADWVAYERGGCVPAVIACGPEGGAAPGACDGVDLAAPGAASGFRIRADGRIAGRWPELGDAPVADGLPPSDFLPSVPPSDFVPAAGPASCPDGWMAAGGGCSPALREDCPSGSGPLPDGTCTATAESDCPAFEYPDVTAEAAGATIVHARAGADPAIADGSMARPFADLASALAAAGDGGWVLLAAGTYDAALLVAASTRHVAGVCSTRVVLATSGADVRFAVGAGGHLDLRDVTLRSEEVGLLVQAGGTAEVARIRVIAAPMHGLKAEGAGASLAASDVYLSGTGAPGIHVSMGASGRIRRASIRGTARGGLVIGHAGSMLAAEDVAVIESADAASPAQGIGVVAVRTGTLALTRVAVAGGTGDGLEIGSGAQATLTDVHVAGGRGAGILLDGESTRGVLERITVRDVDVEASGVGRGLQVQMAAQATVRGLAAIGNQGRGVFVGGMNATLTLEDVLVADTRPDASGADGAGIVAGAQGQLVVRRARVERNRAGGIAAYGIGTSVEVEEARVEGVAGAQASGISAVAGAAATASRCVVLDAAIGAGVQDMGTLRIESSHLGAIRLVGAFAASGSSLDIADSTIEGSPTAAGLGSGGHLRAERVVASRLAIGAYAQGAGAEIELVRSVIRDLADVPDNFTFEGHGLATLDGARGIVDRTRFERTDTLALAAHGVGASVEARDSVVIDVGPGAGNAYGIGALAFTGGAVALERVLIERARTGGVIAYGPGSSLTLADVAVRDTLGSDIHGGHGMGIAVTAGGALQAARVLLDGVREVAVVIETTGEVALSDSIVTSMAPSPSGIGFGVIASTGSTLRMDRLAIDEAQGAAVLAAEAEGAPEGGVIDARDLFVRDIRSAQIRWNASAGAPEGPLVAYGVHSTTRSSATVERAVVDGGGWGFYAAGRLVLREASISRQADAAGGVASAAAREALVLERVALHDNASDEVQLAQSLPQATSLPAPSGVCLDPAGCGVGP